MSDLPNGWERSSLGNLCHLQYGKNLPTNKLTKQGYPVFGANGQIGFYSSYQYDESRVLITCRGATCGTINRTPPRSFVTNNSIVIEPLSKPDLDDCFLEYQLRGCDKSSVITGSAQPQITLANLELLEIKVAPFHEQRRIVEKLEKLLGKVDDCKKRLEIIPLTLKRFRQSILAAACSGRLTANWRESGEEETELPTGWEWIPLENLLPKGGIFDGPFGSNLKTSDYTSSGVRVIRLENIGHLTFFDEKETYISEEKYETLMKHTVGGGDIIFSSFIADEIRVCMLPQFKTKAIAKADCFCLRPIGRLVDQTFLTFQLVSRESYKALVENVHGATRPRINTTQLRKLKIRVCPLPEQQEIVRCVNELFKLADQIEARYNKAKAYVDKLAQSILAKAFRGELVEQDPNDESASVLLERIRAAREQAPGKARRRNV